MIMEFTFTDYTFSGLLSILAALYGVGYPLIIQSIEKISAQYNSARISTKFLEEPIYIAFQVLLVINLIFAISAPFVLHAGWNNFIIITVQAVLLVLLIGQTFLLFRLILRFSSASDLLKHLEGRVITRKNVHHIFDLAVYADEKHLLSLYNASLTDVFRYVSAQQGDMNGSMSSEELPAPKYDADTFELAYRIKEYLRNDDGHHYLYGHNDVVAAFFNQFSSSRIGPDTRKIMWRLANEAIAFDNKSWFMQYWQIADGYAGFKYQFIKPEQKGLKNDWLEFLTQHVMLGAAMIHFKRYSWLNDVFFYTHSSPESYCLIPSSFIEIIYMLRFLESICDKPAFGGRQFYFRDSMVSATDEEYIFREAVRYLSLLIIRLWSLNNRNLMHQRNVLDYPTPPILLSIEEREIRVLQMMEDDIGVWVKNGAFNLIPNLTKVAVEEVKRFVRSYRESCDRDLKEKKEHPVVDGTKYDTLCKDVVDAANSFKPSWKAFLGKLPWDNEKIVIKNVGSEGEMNTLWYSSYMEIGVGELGEMNWKNFTFSMCRGYLETFKDMNLLKAIRVPLAKVGDTMSRIGYSSDYAVIASDGVEGLPPSAIVLNASAFPISLYILPVDNIPIAEAKAYDRNGFEPISKDVPYSTNLYSFIACREPVFKLQFATSLVLHLNATGLEYVRIIVDEDPQAQNNPVDPGWTLKDIFDSRPKESNGQGT